MKKWSIWVTCLLVAVLMMAGMGAIAAEYGSQSDPLITLSYIEQVLLPKTKTDVDAQMAESLRTFEQTVNNSSRNIEQYIDNRLRSFASGNVDQQLVESIAQAIVEKQDGTVTGGEVSWAVVQVPAGGTVVCDVGVQAILRVGKATCVVGGEPGLIDLSNGETLKNGGKLAANHLYTSSIQGRGIHTAEGCTLLIAGSYVIQ